MFMRNGTCIDTISCIDLLMYFDQRRRNSNLLEQVNTSTNISDISIREPNQDLNNSQVALTSAQPISRKRKKKVYVTVHLNDMCCYFSLVNKFYQHSLHCIF